MTEEIWPLQRIPRWCWESLSGILEWLIGQERVEQYWSLRLPKNQCRWPLSISYCHKCRMMKQYPTSLANPLQIHRSELSHQHTSVPHNKHPQYTPHGQSHSEYPASCPQRQSRGEERVRHLDEPPYLIGNGQEMLVFHRTEEDSWQYQLLSRCHKCGGMFLENSLTIRPACHTVLKAIFTSIKVTYTLFFSQREVSASWNTNAEWRQLKPFRKLPWRGLKELCSSDKPANTLSKSLLLQLVRLLWPFGIGIM